MPCFRLSSQQSGMAGHVGPGKGGTETMVMERLGYLAGLSTWGHQESLTSTKPSWLFQKQNWISAHMQNGWHTLQCSRRDVFIWPQPGPPLPSSVPTLCHTREEIEMNQTPTSQAAHSPLECLVSNFSFKRGKGLYFHQSLHTVTKWWSNYFYTPEILRIPLSFNSQWEGECPPLLPSPQHEPALNHTWL